MMLAKQSQIASKQTRGSKKEKPSKLTSQAPPDGVQPVHDEPEHEHLVPLSQQCCLSGQQQALAEGQQPAP